MGENNVNNSLNSTPGRVEFFFQQLLGNLSRPCYHHEFILRRLQTNLQDFYNKLRTSRFFGLLRLCNIMPCRTLNHGFTQMVVSNA